MPTSYTYAVAFYDPALSTAERAEREMSMAQALDAAGIVEHVRGVRRHHAVLFGELHGDVHACGNSRVPGRRLRRLPGGGRFAHAAHQAHSPGVGSEDAGVGQRGRRLRGGGHPGRLPCSLAACFALLQAEAHLSVPFAE